MYDIYVQPHGADVSFHFPDKDLLAFHNSIQVFAEENPEFDYRDDADRLNFKLHNYSTFSIFCGGNFSVF